MPNDKTTVINPLISIIIPTFNRKSLLDLTILSYIEFIENDSMYELIIVDDGSEDNTYEYISQKYNTYISTSQIKLIRLYQNLGPIAARNAGALLARGVWIAFVDSDNRILKTHKQEFEKVIKSTSYPLVLFRCVDENGLLLGDADYKSSWSYKEVLNLGLPECFGVINKELYLYGYNTIENENLRRFEAIGFFRILRKCGSLYLINLPLREYSFDAPNRLSSREGTIKDAKLMFHGNLLLLIENFAAMDFKVRAKNFARLIYYGYYILTNKVNSIRKAINP